MQIVIDVDDKVYGLLKYFEEALGLNYKKDGNDDVKTALMRAVINGTPLPKEHGRLIDYSWVVDNVIKKLGIKDKRYLLEAEKALMSIIEIAPTIIEADGGGEDDLKP